MTIEVKNARKQSIEIPVDNTAPQEVGIKQDVIVVPVYGDAPQYKPGENISISEDGVISVLTADEVETDNTRPVTSAAVATQVGNIEILLKTI